VKAHAYANDFLLVPGAEAAGHDLPGLARAMCDRHAGVGADGLILYDITPQGATMRLLNADGSWSELSGNGVRCLAAVVARRRAGAARPGAGPADVLVHTDAGEKRLVLLETSGHRYTFRAAMGSPEDLRRVALEVAGERVEAVALTVGNPQCVLLEPSLDEERFHRLGPALERHPAFPDRTNVEFAQVEGPDRVRILIWERGVGPTQSSGTGSCAAMVAAAAYGGAARDVQVVAPGGTQRVEWRDEGLYLTGWAEIVLEGHWLG
jgi:diaminopimelate epimerase